MSFRAVRLIMVAALVSLWVGCGADNPLNRQPIDGKVTLNGEPVKKGSIQFMPTDGSQTIAGSKIVDGVYSIPGEKGVAPGEYSVSIRVPDPTWVPKAGENPKETAPPEFSRGEHRVKVAQGSNVFDFDMKAQ